MNGRRRIGQETEYAIRRPAPSNQPESNDRNNHSLFLLIRGYITDHCRCLPGYRDFYQSQFFTESGSAFAYEALPTAERDGLIEGATPECFTPLELLRYQRAQEMWLVKALRSRRIRHDRSFHGCGLLKNCRDAEGHTYGSQENYEVEIGGFHHRWLYRLLVCLAIPVTFLGTAFMILMFLGMLFGGGLLILTVGFLSFMLELVATAIPVATLVSLSRWARRTNERVLSFASGFDEERGTRLANYTLLPILVVTLTPFSWALSHLTFRNVRRALTGFLISRPVISGAGCLLDDEQFVLSEKTSVLEAVLRTRATMASRSIFDSGNLLKGIHLAALDCFVLRKNNWRFLLHRHQRLQIGCSDANRCDVAEYLKIGTTLLVIEMAEAGYLQDAPFPRSAIQAAHQYNNDTSLASTAAMQSGDAMSALELQFWYLERAQSFLRERTTYQEIFQPVVARWQYVVKTLAAGDPEQLIGQLDWVTKKCLLDEAGHGQGATVKKRIDLAYHELGSGYFDRFDQAGLATRMVDRSEIESALFCPPSPPSAQARSRFIRSESEENSPWVISWHWALRGLFLKQSQRDFESKH